MDTQQGPTIQYMQLCSMLGNSLDGRVICGRRDTYICMAESLHCSPETTTTLLIGLSQNKKKFFKLKKKRERNYHTIQKNLALKQVSL